MKRLQFDYAGFVAFTPPGDDKVRKVSSVTILDATSYTFGANGVAVTTEAGDAIVPYGFIGFTERPAG